MDDKLIRFFNKINFDEIDDFEGVKVSKVVINKQKESWIVYLQSDKVINPESMIKLINKAKDGIENVNMIDIKISYSNINDEDIIKYFKYFLDQKVIDNVSLQSIINNDFKVENNEISVEVISKMEANLIDSFNDEFSKYLKLYATELTEWDGNPATKPREYLQNIGDLVRSMDSNFLISRMIEDIEVYKNYVQNVIISDVRFPKEIDEMALNYDNVYSIYVDNQFRESTLSLKEQSHPSETSLETYPDFDLSIANDSDLNSLKDKVFKFLEGIENENK